MEGAKLGVLLIHARKLLQVFLAFHSAHPDKDMRLLLSSNQSIHTHTMDSISCPALLQEDLLQLHDLATSRSLLGLGCFPPSLVFICMVFQKAMD
jgi:hypothetical protein